MSKNKKNNSPSGGGGGLLDPSKWYFEYGVGNPGASGHPQKDGNGFKFDFPRKPNQIDYLETSYTKAMNGNFHITGSIDLNGEMWVAPDDMPPAHFSLLVRRGTDLTQEFNRFWYFHFPIVNGPFNISVPLDGMNWISVFGKKDPAKFKKLIAAPSAIGLTFGGNSFAGHGVGMKSGTATLHVTSIDIG